MKGNEWVKKAGYFCGGCVRGGKLTSHNSNHHPSGVTSDTSSKGSISAALTIPKLQKLGCIYLHSQKNEHIPLQKCCLEDYVSSDMLPEIR